MMFKESAPYLVKILTGICMDEMKQWLGIYFNPITDGESGWGLVEDKQEAVVD